MQAMKKCAALLVCVLVLMLFAGCANENGSEPIGAIDSLVEASDSQVEASTGQETANLEDLQNELDALLAEIEAAMQEQESETEPQAGTEEAIQAEIEAARAELDALRESLYQEFLAEQAEIQTQNPAEQAELQPESPAEQAEPQLFTGTERPSELTHNWFFGDIIHPKPFLEPGGPAYEIYAVGYRLFLNGDAYRINQRRSVGGGGVALPDLIGYWTFGNNAVHIHYDTGETESFSVQGNELHGSRRILVREMVVSEENRRLMAEADVYHARQAALMRRFHGEWRLDVLTWNFDADTGTGYIDIPAFNRHPASTEPFRFDVMLDTPGSPDGTLVLYFDDEPAIRTAMYRVTFGNRSGGSVELYHIGNHQTILLTRQFDINNTPFMDDVIDQAMGLLGKLKKFM